VVLPHSWGSLLAQLTLPSLRRTGRPQHSGILNSCRQLAYRDPFAFGYLSTPWVVLSLHLLRSFQLQIRDSRQLFAADSKDGGTHLLPVACSSIPFFSS
jgi:hypothetical protein